MRNSNWMLRISILAVLLSVTFAANAADKIKGREVYFDFEELPPEYDLDNPYIILVEFLNGDTLRMHDGQRHPIGNLIQVIRDGGNNKIDPPNADGTPGGDDSLAWGNFNHSRVGAWGLSATDTVYFGVWVSQKYFVSYYPDGVYYLRLWEGSDAKTAPYYQDSREYKASTGDRGGSMARISPRLFYGPNDITWTFGSSVERPKK